MSIGEVAKPACFVVRSTGNVSLGEALQYT